MTSDVAKRFVEVAFVDVLLIISRFVMVLDAEFTSTPSPAASGERNAPPSVQLEDPPEPPTHVPLIEKQPPAMLRPY